MVMAVRPMSRRCVRHHRGRGDYNLRGQTVQPIVGQIKTCQKLTTMSRRGVQQRVAARRRRPQPAQAAFAPMQQLTEERHRKPMITIGPASFPPPTFPGLPQTVYATGSRMHSAIPVHQLGMSGVRLQVASSTALWGVAAAATERTVAGCRPLCHGCVTRNAGVARLGR
jgi:hypothetical protein